MNVPNRNASEAERKNIIALLILCVCRFRFKVERDSLFSSFDKEHDSLYATEFHIIKQSISNCSTQRTLVQIRQFMLC